MSRVFSVKATARLEAGQDDTVAGEGPPTTNPSRRIVSETVPQREEASWEAEPHPARHAGRSEAEPR
jgi:hypothetical protein